MQDKAENIEKNDGELIPIFPLNIVVMPNERVQLHIFEERYRQLIDDCKNASPYFGIPFYNKKRIQPVGTLVKLHSVDKIYPSGEMDITVVGAKYIKISRFLNRYPDKKYSAALMMTYKIEESLNNNIVGAFAQVIEKQGEPEPWTRSSNLRLEELIQFLNLSNDDRYRLITAKTHSQFNSILMEKIKLLELLQEQENAREAGLYLN